MMKGHITSLLLSITLLLSAYCHASNCSEVSNTSTNNPYADSSGRTTFVDSLGNTHTGNIVNNQKEGLWKTLSNGELIEAVYYEADTILETLDVADFNLKSIKTHNIAVEIPEKWRVTLDTAGVYLLAIKPFISEDIISPKIVVAKINEDPQLLNLEGMIDKAKRDIQETFKSYTMIGEESLMINGLDTYRLAYFLKIDNRKFACNNYIFHSDKAYYQISTVTSGGVHEFAKYDDVFKEIAQSFRVWR